MEKDKVRKQMAKNLPVVEVNYEEAKKLVDYSSIQNDLRFMIEQLSRLLKLLKEKSEDRILIQSFFTSALIAYFRCFSHGKRLRLSPNIFKDLKGEPLGVHNYYKNLRDKLVAHSVNPFEETKVGLVLSNPKERPPKIEGVVRLSRQLISLTPEGVNNFLKLALHAESFVGKQIQKYITKTLKAGKHLSIDALYSKSSMKSYVPSSNEAGTTRCS